MTRPGPDTFCARVDNPLEEFVAFAANVTDAHTVALLTLNPNTAVITMAAGWSLSDSLDLSIALPLDSEALIAELFRAGRPWRQAFFEDDSSRIGIYLAPEPVRACMSAPVGDNGLLWVDTRKAYRFTPKGLKNLAGLAAIARRVDGFARRLDSVEQERPWLDVSEGLLARCGREEGAPAPLADTLVGLVTEKTSFEAALTATYLPDRELLRITANKGFSGSARPGRLVALRNGWIRRALEDRRPVAIQDLSNHDGPHCLCHPGENIGLSLRRLAVIPWRTETDEAVSVLAAASETPASESPGLPLRLTSLAHLVELLDSHGRRGKLLRAVRGYDSESGALNEAAFRTVACGMFDAARKRGGSLALITAEIENLDEVYSQGDPALARRCLGTVTDLLMDVQSRPCAVGKFRTGVFGLLMEGVDPHDLPGLLKRARRLLGAGRIAVQGTPLEMSVRLSAAHYPDNCRDLTSMWVEAQRRDGLPASRPRGWSSLPE